MAHLRFHHGVLVVALAASAIVFCPRSARAQDAKTLFTGICTACHTIGGGKRVGPDLAGVTKRRSRAWLVSFIKSSQTMVKSGDATAVKLFNKYNKAVMPDSTYTDSQIASILSYIESQGGSATDAPSAAQPWASRPPTATDIEDGRWMFEGLTRFAKGGPACNSCHHVRDDAVIGGGILAKDLTSVFSSMGGDGVRAILGQPPFPVMEQAYKSHPLTNRERFVLIAFLQHADKQKAFQQPGDVGAKLFFGGLGGLGLLLALYGLIWARRKKRSVNDEIYRRQIRSW
jgi:mono/diheme cytochrome c family protein